VQRQIQALADELLTLATAKGQPSLKPRIVGTDSRTFSGEATKRCSRTSWREAPPPRASRDGLFRFDCRPCVVDIRGAVTAPSGIVDRWPS